MPIFTRRTQSATTAQPAGAVPGQRDTQEGTTNVQAASSATGTAPAAAATGTAPPAQTERRQAEAAEYRPEEARREHYGMAAVLMILSGMLTFFIGITGVIRGVFFNNVASFPFYYSVRSRGVTLLVIGAVAFVVGIALLVHLHWARHVATVVAVFSAVANFIFLPFYPFWSVIVLAIDVIIIWELTRDRERGRREYAHLPRPALPPPRDSRS
jgi:hypothetical protein